MAAQCDCVTATATATATMVFFVGPHAGRPIFDLRQTVAGVRLDGVAITSDISYHVLNGEGASRVRVLARDLESGSTYTLQFDYDIEEPASNGARPLDWQTSPRGLTWDFWFTDLSPGRYLEMWFPANLIYDEHELSVELELLGAQTTHSLVTNAFVSNLGTHHWRLDWAAMTSSFGPVLYLTPSSNLVSQTSMVNMPGSRLLTLELHELTTV